MPLTHPSRRAFLKATVVAGVSVVIAPLGGRAFAALFEEKILTPVQWDPKTGTPKFRIDGIAKVTGDKVFARDIRSRDMPHWPQQQSHAFILRTTLADRTYEGFDLSLLGDELKPDRVVTAEDLARDGVAFPAFYGDDMLLPTGKTPAYHGHAVAILIYHDFAHFRFAKDKLKQQKEYVQTRVNALEETMKEKVKLAIDTDVQGMAVWALGYESNTVLEPLKQFKRYVLGYSGS